MCSHMAIGCNASPTKATLPNVRGPRGGGQSERLSRLVSVCDGMLSIRDRKGSAHVEANLLINEMLPSSVSGTATGDGESKNPSRTGQETTIWQVYFALLFVSSPFPGALSTACN